jgi:hypothetical protein
MKNLILITILLVVVVFPFSFLMGTNFITSTFLNEKNVYKGSAAFDVFSEILNDLKSYKHVTNNNEIQGFADSGISFVCVVGDKIYVCKYFKSDGTYTVYIAGGFHLFVSGDITSRPLMKKKGNDYYLADPYKDLTLTVIKYVSIADIKNIRGL